MSTTLKLFDGPVTFYIKEYTGSDNDPFTGNVVDWTDFVQLAYLYHSDDQPVITIDGNVEEVKVGGFNTSVERVLMSESCTIKTMVKKATLADLEYSFIGGEFVAGAIPGTDPDEFSVGDGAVKIYSVALLGSADSGEDIVVFVQRNTLNQSFEFSYKKGDNEIPFQFDALSDTEAAAGKRLLRIREVTAA